MFAEVVLLKIKRGNTPAFRALKQIYRWTQCVRIPIPKLFRPVGSFLFSLQFILWAVGKRTMSILVREPLFRCRCESAGKNISLWAMPDVVGHATICIGDDVTMHGKFGLYTGRVFDRAVLTIGNRVSIGHQVTISCNKEVTIEDDVYIASTCAISDNDGHPLDMESRITGMPAPAERTKSVRICRGAWIGGGSFILKGVTIGQGSIVGANSVVTSNVPPFTVVAGSQATIVKQCARATPEAP